MFFSDGLDVSGPPIAGPLTQDAGGIALLDGRPANLETQRNSTFVDVVWGNASCGCVCALFRGRERGDGGAVAASLFLLRLEGRDEIRQTISLSCAPVNIPPLPLQPIPFCCDLGRSVVFLQQRDTLPGEVCESQGIVCPVSDT